MNNEQNRKIYNECRDLIYNYLSFARVYIKTKKAEDENLAKADTDFDMYEILFLEGLNRALRTEAKDAYRVFSDEVIDDVSKGIQKILKERKTFGFVLANRRDVIFIGSRVFHDLVERARQLTERQWNLNNE